MLSSPLRYQLQILKLFLCMVRRGWSCGKDDFLHEVCVHASRLDDVSPPPSLSPADEYQLDDEENTRRPQHRPSTVHNLRLLVPFQALGIRCGQYNDRSRMENTEGIKTKVSREATIEPWRRGAAREPEGSVGISRSTNSKRSRRGRGRILAHPQFSPREERHLCLGTAQGVEYVIGFLNCHVACRIRDGVCLHASRLDDVSPPPSLSPADEYQLDDEERCCISEVLLLRQLRECAETYSGVAEGSGFQRVLGPGGALCQVAANTRWKRILIGGIVFGLAWAPFSAPEFSSSPARRLTNTPALLSSLSSTTLSLPWRYRNILTMRALYTKASISVPKSFKQPKYCHHSLSPLRPPFLSSLPTPRFPSLQISRPPPQTQRRSLTRASMASSQSSGTGQGAEEPTKPFSVLFVCLGNICRSPAAEGVPIKPSDFKDFDLILAMDEQNKDDILRAFEKWSRREALPADAHEKVHLMCSYCKKHDETEVPDPYYGGPQGFEKVLDLLEDACDSLLDTILAQKGQKFKIAVWSKTAYTIQDDSFESPSQFAVCNLALDRP
nr:putative low molecular weight protein-tyrosine-phosphatase slr0328 [Ipomoea batatas]